MPGRQAWGSDPKINRFIYNVTRVEICGSLATGCIHVKVDPKGPDLLTFKPWQYRPKRSAFAKAVTR